MAEREGFEPPIRFPVYTLSRRAVSTTHPSLRVRAGCHRNTEVLPRRLRSGSGFRQAAQTPPKRLNFRGVRFQPLTHLSALSACPVVCGHAGVKLWCKPVQQACSAILNEMEEDENRTRPGFISGEEVFASTSEQVQSADLSPAARSAAFRFKLRISRCR